MNNQTKTAFKFIIFLGIVSLFGDITYEGARSVTGPYLAFLGASASIVGLVAGLGEFMGYALRMFFGYLSDRTRSYWPLTIAGYGLLFSIPLLAFAGYWQVAAFLIILERMGKAIRTPARDTILSHATKNVGRGWGFGVHEALDQVGAIIGPLVFSLVFLFKGGYRYGFSILWIPAVLTLAILIVARIKVPSPVKFEVSEAKDEEEAKYRKGGKYKEDRKDEKNERDEKGRKDIQDKNRLPRAFWFYTLFTFLGVAGFSNFQLISYHFKVQSVISDTQIPLFYAIAMGVDALVALIIGKTYDKIGMRSLMIIPLLTIPIPFFAFSHSYGLAITSAILWGAVLGIHETIMRAAIADITPVRRRGFAYGVFNTVYGLSWLFGSAVMGLLYEVSISYLALFVIIVEVISLPVFLLVRKDFHISEDKQF